MKLNICYADAFRPIPGVDSIDSFYFQFILLHLLSFAAAWKSARCGELSSNQINVFIRMNVAAAAADPIPQSLNNSADSSTWDSYNR